MTKLWAALNLLGLLCSVVGGVLLFLCLTLKASNYRFVEKSDHSVAICLNDRSVATGFGGGLIVTDEPCPLGIGPSVAPVIEAEKPAYVPWGLGLIWVGFLLQSAFGIARLIHRIATAHLTWLPECPDSLISASTPPMRA